MAYRYLGYGITNDKGIAKLEFDANGNPITHSYTGTGAGELDIIASLDDNEHISDSSLQSETYEVLDCAFLDGSSANWYAQGGTNSFSEGVRTFTTSDWKYLVPHTSSGSSWSQDFAPTFCLEMNLNTTTATNIALQIADATHTAETLDITSYLTNDSKLVLKVYDTKFEGFVDGATNPTFSKTYANTFTGNLRIGIRVNAGTITFSNFKIYPI